MARKPKLIHQGQRFTVYGAGSEGEKSQVFGYLDGLKESNVKLHARLMVIIKKFAEGQPPKDAIETIKGEGLIRIKVPGEQTRLLGTYIPRQRAVLLYGFDKKDRAIKRQHIDKAQAILAEFQEVFIDWI